MLPTQIAAAIEKLTASAMINHTAAAPKLRRGSSWKRALRNVSEMRGRTMSAG
jgi:hypothetical protein